MATIHTSIFTNWNEWSIRVPPNLAPLTTLFEPPAGCSNQWTIRPDNEGTVMSGWDDSSDRDVPTDYYARCSPYNLTTAQYSPGMCSSGQAVLNITEAQFQGSTLWWGSCCDRGMTVHEGACAKAIISSMMVLTPFTSVMSETILCGFEHSNSWFSTFTVSALDMTLEVCEVLHENFRQTEIITFRRPPTAISSGSAIAAAFKVYWQYSDLSVFPRDYASSLASVMKVPFDGATSALSALSNDTNATSTPSPTNSNSKRPSLNPGAIAGIAIGIGALVISSIVALLYLWRRRKQRQRLQHPGIPEMEGSSRGLKRFVGGKWRAETDGTSNLVEAGSGSVMIIPGPPVELDGTQRERDL